MAIITTQLLKDMNIAASEAFSKGLGETPDLYSKIAQDITSSKGGNTYKWLDDFSHMKELVGDLTFEDIKANSYYLANKEYGTGVQISRAQIEDEEFGQLSTVIQLRGKEGKNFINRSVAKLANDGWSTGLCYDGKPFFSAEHPVFPNSDGTGDAIPTSNIIGAGTENGSPWYLIDTKTLMKPFIVQTRKKMQLYHANTPENPDVLLRRLFSYTIEWRGGFGYSFWQSIVGSKQALTEANFNSAYLQMQQIKRNGGDPIGLTPDTLLVSPANRAAAMKLIETTNNGNNTNYKIVDIIVNPWLA